MRTLHKFLYATAIVIVINTIVPSSAEIHRAKNIRQHKPRRPVFNDEDSSPPGDRYPFDDHNIPSDVANPYTEQDPHFPSLPDVAKSKHGYDGTTWFYSLISAALVGLSGIFPLLIIRINDVEESGKGSVTIGDGEGKEFGGGARLRLLLSFAVGGLLGDVFLHLLPETWAHLHTVDDYISCGLWVIAGLLSFLCIEKMFPDSDDEDSQPSESTAAAPSERFTEELNHMDWNSSGEEKGTSNGKQNKKKNNNGLAGGSDNGNENGISNGKLNNDVNSQKLKNSAAKLHQGNGSASKAPAAANSTVVRNGKASTNGSLRNGETCMNGHHHKENGKPTAGNAKCVVKESKSAQTHIKTSGWLNLLANVIDNFTHGLAVAASYSVSTKTGLLTTGAILLHEIPHEIGDFAILLRSGFDRWKAAKAQLITATGGICGAFVALCASSVQEAGNQSSWMLPFTSGGFLYIALVTVLPDLLADNKPMESLKQMLLLGLGIFVMQLVTCID